MERRVPSNVTNVVGQWFSVPGVLYQSFLDLSDFKVACGVR